MHQRQGHELSEGANAVCVAHEPGGQSSQQRGQQLRLLGGRKMDAHLHTRCGKVWGRWGDGKRLRRKSAQQRGQQLRLLCEGQVHA